MSIDPQNDFRCSDLEYDLIRKILSRLTFITGDGVNAAYVNAAIAAQAASDAAIYELKANKSTDGTLAANSDTLYPSQKATKTYVDTGLAGKQNTLGYVPENVSNKATNLVTINDVLYPTVKAVTDALALKQNSLGFTPENSANKAIDFSVLNNVLYPTTQAVADYITAFGGDYVLKAGDTMTGPLLITAIADGTGPALFLDKENSAADLSIYSDAHLHLNNDAGGQTFIAFSFASVAAGGIRADSSNNITYSTNAGSVRFSPASLDGSGFTIEVRSAGDVRLGPNPGAGLLFTYDYDPGPEQYFLALRGASSAPGMAALRAYSVYTSDTNYERVNLEIGRSSPDAYLFMEVGSGGGTIRDLILGIRGASQAVEHIRLSGDNDAALAAIGFFNTTPTNQQTSGANLTNNVTAGGVDNTINDVTIGTTLLAGADGASTRNAIYQLARKLKQINDGLRAYGLFT